MPTTDTLLFSAADLHVEDTTQLFDLDTPKPRPVPGREGERYIPFGSDDRLPYELIARVSGDEVTAQNKLFNVLTCYGAGVVLLDPATGAPTQREEVRSWVRRQNLPLFFLEQSTDMKYFFFSVCVLILNKKGDRINKLRHKEASFCRLSAADREGRIPYVYSAPWGEGTPRPDQIERIPLLDPYDPLGDLHVRLGNVPDDRGRRRPRCRDRKFAILVRFPTAGSPYYPTPYWTSVFRGGSYDEKRLISVGKRAKLRNHTSVRYQVEVQRDYWERICREERISDDASRLARIRKEKENIRNFLCGLENSDKVWVTGFYTDPTGHEVRDVRITLVESRKEGGEWAEDVQAAANTICYAENIHPNMVGATPGKSQTNNSGSDKRELFTMKQALEIAYHDLLLLPLRVVAGFHGWKEEPSVPMIQLTTLDEHRDARRVDPQHPSPDDH